MHHVAEKTAEYPVEAPARHVRLFRNGANQAVRIPKEFELPGKEAVMHREGDKLIIEPIQPKHPKGSAAALLAALESMKSWEPMLEEFPDVDEGLLPLDDIKL
ncbi:antitoxin [Polaromonas sp. JS666]|uniref:antitoxin n=1 Tax=Polaromonas sp. (strain JS666 / ATCC BAA-500) TaxID=296591 RepID=UPI0000536F96|nr:AbrB/MazE/SpoVT family DNA-binding domain-containing protein [Polaromonas sp. JS666]ABE44634.1 virulence-associated protein VapB-like protein [Polaromonas sp. JS666]